MKVEDKTLFLKPILGKSASKASQKPAFSSNTLRVTNNTPQEGFKRNITLAAKKYTFSFFMDKGLEDLNDKEYFSVDIINSSNAIVYTYTTKVNTTGYYNFDYSATTAGTYTWRFRRVSLNGRSSSGIAYFDDFKASYTIQQSQQVCSSPKNYRFGFNTQEKDDEVYGAGNLNTAMFWEYDTRLGRRWNVDPKPQVEISVYAAMNGNPIWLTDVNGDCPPGVKCGDVVNFVPHINNQGTENKNRFERVKRTKPNGKTYFHQGLDILVPSNTKLRVIMSGEVMKNQTTHISDEYSGSRRPRQAQHEGTNGLGNSLIVKTILPEDYSYTPEGGKEMNLKKGQAIFIRYSHMELVGPEEGALVKTGEPIGYSGATGNAGFYKGDWGIEEKYRHVHIEASTDVNFKNKLDPEAFVKTQYNSKGKVIPSSGDGSRPKGANNVIKDF